jgi:predicted dehydrogenase
VRCKVLFVGLGSIGQRHLRNIITLFNSRNIDFQIDALRTKNQSHDGIANVYIKTNELPSDYDIAFVTNPTNAHYETMLFLQDKAKHLFVEKPIFDRVRDFSFKSGICYVACPLRFNPVVRSLKQFVQSNNVFAFRAICSSYLPDWRPGTNYKTNYSAIKSMGGGVELDLIHEIDYLTWIFGKTTKLHSVFGKKSNLEIDSNDLALYILEFVGVLGSLHLDYFGRYSEGNKREIEVFTNNDTVLFDIVNSRISYQFSSKITPLDKEDPYLNEMNYFLDLITSDNPENYNNCSSATETLKIALGGQA